MGYHRFQLTVKPRSPNHPTSGSDLLPCATSSTGSILDHLEMETSGRRVVPMSDWAPAQDTEYGESSSSATKRMSTSPEHMPPPSQTRGRSLSVSPPWLVSQSSTVFEDDDTDNHNLDLGKSKSHGFHGRDFEAHGQAAPSKHGQQSKFTRFVRRASISLRSGVKGIVHRRTSVPAAPTFGGSESHQQQQGRSDFLSPPNPPARPTTSHSPWNRLRQATSFHRHSRMLYTGHGERTFEADLAPIESPTFPVPGSREQPPIIPRNTGAAARQAAASAYTGMQGQEYMDGDLPRPGWPEKDGLDDHESGIGIALTSTEEIDAYLQLDEVDSDVDVGETAGEDETDISKVDFISQLPIELAIQILAQLDAATLAAVSLVSTKWNFVLRNQHIWRESFMREKTVTYATSRPIKPGAGMGVPNIQPGKNWKEVYRVKEELDRRWTEGKARPVYLHGHSDSIYCLQFDETKIITGSRDKTIRIWDMHTYACKLVIGPPEVINDSSLSLLYDEAGHAIHHATLPDLEPPAGERPQTPARAYDSAPALYSPPIYHRASILCLQYDDRILVTGSSDATCIVYNIKSGYRPVRRLKHHSAAVLDLVFDEKHIVTCSKDISICVWDRATGALVRQLRGHAGPVNAVQMRGNTIVSCSGDFRVKLWNIDTGRNIREFLGHTKGLACSQFSEDGRYVASAGNDRVIRIWDANTGECVREMKAHDNLVRSLHVDSVSGRLVSGSYDTDIKVWDMETGQQLLDFPQWHSSWVLSAKSDYRRIISSGQDPKILIMDFGADIEGIELLESGVAAHAGSQRKIFGGENGGYI